MSVAQFRSQLLTSSVNQFRALCDPPADVGVGRSL